ncbi:DUF4136 domain-containing protein [Catalinimonas sp. 4WD22]|uniref:DUF4136 domain-containing protein n=1 Tax=Catalinimonas locisalis TaxID=3133978 RepID=UPI0031013C45
MRKNYSYLTLSFLLNLLFLNYACTPVKIISNKLEPEAGSGKYQTFNFYDLKVKSPRPEEVKEVRFDMLKDAVQRELEAIGLEKAEDPDLWVNIGVLVEDKVQTRETDIREAPMYIGQRNYHWESEEVVVDEYREGTVTIDLIDAETNKMVGQSVASGIIVENDEKLQKRIDEGMAKVFDDLWASRK